MTFRVNPVTEEAAHYGVFDRLFVRLSNGQGMSTDLITLTNRDAWVMGNADGTYVTSGPIDLAAYRGSPMTLTFEAANDGVFATVFRLDDISLRAGAPGSTPKVTLVANDAGAGEPFNAGQFIVSRTGSTEAPLAVYFMVGGTAVNGADYGTITSPLQIPPGSSSASITVNPVNDTVAELEETVQLALTASSAYVVAAPTNATVQLTSDDALLPPTNVTATALSPATVQLSWQPGGGATSYAVERRSSAGTLTVAYAGTSPYLDTTVQQGMAYLYSIRSAGEHGQLSVPSNSNLATTIVFSDDPLLPRSTTAKVAHILELREAVDAVRVLAGIGPFTYDPVASGTRIRAAHITQLRSALQPALNALGIGSSAYTDASLSAGQLMKVVHVQEVRTRCK